MKPGSFGGNSLMGNFIEKMVLLSSGLTGPKNGLSTTSFIEKVSPLLFVLVVRSGILTGIFIEMVVLPLSDLTEP
jgi:hypothetical protein